MTGVQTCALPISWPGWETALQKLQVGEVVTQVGPGARVFGAHVLSKQTTFSHLVSGVDMIDMKSIGEVKIRIEQA